MFIYLITNKLNGKHYVGRTTRSIDIRWKEHIKCMHSGDQRHLYVAMRKYGLENFIIEELCQCDCLEDLSDKEHYFCSKYDAYTDGYNMTEAGESNPMDCLKSRESHDIKMRSTEVREKISKTMKAVREQSKHHVYVHKGREQKRIDPKELEQHLSDGWLSGAISGKIRLHKEDGTETSIFEEDLEKYLNDGWILGGKPNRLSPEHKQKLAESHGPWSDEFKKQQSERLKNFYKENPDWKTKSKHAVMITDPNDSNISYQFQSCQDLVKFIDVPLSVAKAGIVKTWVTVGYIKRKNCKYYNWIIKYI